jgi:hypothetical protein
MKPKHLLIFLVFTILMNEKTFTQPVIKTQRTIGGNSDDALTAIALTNDGGLIAGGASYSDISGEKTENGRGQQDFWLVKLSKSGAIQLDKTIGGNSSDYLESMFMTRDGGYFLAGWSSSTISGEKTENSRGSIDYWVVKLDKSGNIQWDKTIGGNDLDYLKSAQQTRDGGYILAGFSYSDASGEKTDDNHSEGEADYWVVKLDGAGNIQWDKTLGGIKADFCYAVVQGNDEGYLVAGDSQSDISGDKTGNNKGVADYWIVKLDKFGNVQWDKTIGGNMYDQPAVLQRTVDGGYIIGGSSPSGISGDKTEASKGSTDYWIVKIDVAGNIQWNKTIGGNKAEGLSSLEQTIDGGYILGGYSFSDISGDKTEFHRGEGDDDYWVVKINGGGNVQWDKTIGGFDNDELADIKEVKRNVYVTGGSSVSDIWAEKEEHSRGYSDYWIVSLIYQNTDPITSVEHEDNNLNSRNEFKVYPNPVKDMLHVYVSGKASISLIDASSKIVLTKAIENSGVIDVAQLPSGLYYLKNAATGKVKKVVVAK